MCRGIPGPAVDNVVCCLDDWSSVATAGDGVANMNDLIGMGGPLRSFSLRVRLTDYGPSPANYNLTYNRFSDTPFGGWL